MCARAREKKTKNKNNTIPAQIEKEPNFRLYTVDAQQLIKVTLRNLSISNDIKLRPVYVTDTGEEEPEDMVDLKCCGEVSFSLARSFSLSRSPPPPSLSLPLLSSPSLSLPLPPCLPLSALVCVCACGLGRLALARSLARSALVSLCVCGLGWGADMILSRGAHIQGTHNRAHARTARARARFLSLTRACAHTHRSARQEYELPFPLQKKSGEAEDAWAIKDANGRTVLKLRFRVA